MNPEEFIKNMYPHPKSIRQRKNHEIINKFKNAVEEITIGFCRHFDNFQDSLRYKRLYYLRKEYKQLITNKMDYADLQ